MHSSLKMVQNKLSRPNEPRAHWAGPGGQLPYQEHLQPLEGGLYKAEHCRPASCNVFIAIKKASSSACRS